jgi:protein SCO1
MPKRPPPAVLALAAVLAAAIVVAAILISHPGDSMTTPRTSTAGAASGFDGAALPPAIGASDFALTDQSGRRVSLSDYRGQVVVVAFLYSTCGATCIVIAQQIRGALDELDDEHASPPAVLIVSADPAADTPAHVARFLTSVSLSGRVRYLTGSVSQLRPIWHSYDITPATSGAAAFDRVASVLLIDAEGNKRVLFESEQLTPESLSHDIGRLDGDPTHP